MNIPSDRNYSSEHEWVLMDPDGTALIGISDFAQDQLGDVVYVELPPVGTELVQFSAMGEVESVKSVSELFAPISGEVVETNSALNDKPELVNQDPYGAGWMIRIRVNAASEVAALMNSEQYQAHTE